MKKQWSLLRFEIKLTLSITEPLNQTFLSFFTVILQGMYNWEWVLLCRGNLGP